MNLYLGYVDREVLQHNKQLDSTALRVLRKIFAEADNTDRCGKTHMCLRLMCCEWCLSQEAAARASSISEQQESAAKAVRMQLGKQFGNSLEAVDKQIIAIVSSKK